MANTKGSDNPFPSVLFAEHVDPANPPADHQRLFVDTDHLLKMRDSSGTVTTFSTGGFSDPMTSRGDIIIRDASNVTARLAKGSAGTVLTSDGTDVAWAASSAPTIIRGAISTTGTVTRGSGFSASRTGTGDVTATFTSAFGATPVVVATAESGNLGRIVTVFSVSTTAVRFKIVTDGGSAADEIVNFLAIAV